MKNFGWNEGRVLLRIKRSPRTAKLQPPHDTCKCLGKKIDTMAKNKEKFYDYDGFVEKFKPKKTIDDCYTPPEVYDIVLKHVREKYNIADDVPIVRPFYPGGDYENYDYPEGCVVVDNPPFSIFATLQSSPCSS